MKQLIVLAVLSASSCFGAANILLVASGSTVDSTGITVTVPLSGGTGTASGGSTGVTITGNLGGTANSMEIGSCVASGVFGVSPVLTCTMNAPIYASETVNVALSASSNLTDTGGNTPTGNNINVATNSATTTGAAANAYSDAACATGGGGVSPEVFGGQFGVGSGYLGQNYCGMVGQDAIAIVSVTGSSASRLMPPGFTCNWTVDGGSNQTYSASGTVWVRAKLFAGLSDAAHTLVFKQACWPSTSNKYMFAGGSSPAYAIPSGYSQTQYTLKDNLTLFCRNGMGVSTTNGYTNIYTSDLYSDVCLHTNASDIWVWMYQGGAWPVNVLQDGSSISTHTIANNGTYGWEHMATGLSGTHDYRLQFSSTAASGQFFSAWEIMTPGGTATGTATTNLTGVEYGDSITAQIGVSDPRSGDFWELGQAVTIGNYGLGNSGEKVYTFLRDHANSTCITPAKIVMFQGGTNDTGGATSQVNFTAAYQTMLANADACGASGAIFIARGLLPKTTDPAPTVNTVSGWMSTAVDNYNGTTPTHTAYYMDVSTWGFIPATMTDDGTHPNATGARFLAAHQVAPFQRYLYGCGKSSGLTPKCNGVM